MTTSTLENTQLIPGYITTERIGSGGYGEVWRAEAPGGFLKAIKIVYGFHDDERARRELKALDRIKGVRHPFLLSVERAEIVDGRLAILMELADQSLDQRFEQCREEGLPGIPRDELLGYLHDTADALDFLLQRHTLQHLDIKPENLLLVAGHVKVADFGLVKDVTDRSQYSMVGGMTPTYAAPELFDGRPSPHSDQYSLAIVYQEMLTGALPFPGRTSAQLAMQHTQGRPMLTSLPVQDREIIAKALSKAPSDRFSSCLEFIETLRGDRTSAASRSAATRRGNEQPASDGGQFDETESLASGATECLATDGDRSHDEARAKRPSSQRIVRTEAIDARPSQADSRPVVVEPRASQPLLRASTRVIDAAMPDDVPQEASLRPTLYVGIGGTGARVLSAFRARLTRISDAEWSRVFPFLVLDTDRLTLQAAEGGEFGGKLTKRETCHLPLKRPQHYRSESTALLQWLSRRWLYNIPRTLQTRGFRPLGRLALVDHALRVQESLRERLQPLGDRTAMEAFASEVGISCRTPAPRVVLIASINGGTGGGMAVDIAYAARAIAAQLAAESGEAPEKLDVVGIFAHATRRRQTENELSIANAYSWLSELATIAHGGYRGTRAADVDAACFEGEGFPFQAAYFVHLGDDLGDQEGENAIADLAEYLACDAVSPLAASLERCRQLETSTSPNPDGDVRLRSFAVARLAHELPDTEEAAPDADVLSGSDETRQSQALPQPEHAEDCEMHHEEGTAEDPLAAGLANIAILPHGCGHTRRVITIAPAAEQQAELAESLRRAVPAGAVIVSNVEIPLLLYEAEGLSLAHMADKLVESRPDAVDAAHRLHIRNDIEWQNLPRVVVEDE